ncbi:MAG: YbjN domain-containing protein [Kiritimatiellae bacterium]|nr:YbjN domain-containing protein [Kiritimatiellia bacterium]
MKVENIRTFQNLIDEEGFTYRREGDRIVIPQEADNDYRYNVICRLGYEEESHIFWILGQSAQDFPKDKHGELVCFCNDWNMNKRWPKVCVTVYDNGVLDVITKMEMQGLEYDVSADFLRDNIKAHLAFNWQFWTELGKQFK